jgi:hypothetical protein
VLPNIYPCLVYIPNYFHVPSTYYMYIICIGQSPSRQQNSAKAQKRGSSKVQQCGRTKVQKCKRATVQQINYPLHKNFTFDMYKIAKKYKLKRG